MKIKKLIKEVRRIASENPDFVYLKGDEGCTYSGNQCIFGIALNKLHPDVDLSKYDECGGIVINMVLDDLFYEDSMVHLNWCVTVQAEQDLGNSWSECIRTADEAYPLGD